MGGATGAACLYVSLSTKSGSPETAVSIQGAATFRIASKTETGVVPISAANASKLSWPVEFTIKSLWSSLASCRPKVYGVSRMLVIRAARSAGMPGPGRTRTSDGSCTWPQVAQLIC